MRDEHLLDIVRMIQQVNVKAADFDMNDVAVVLGHAGKKPERIAARLQKYANQPCASRSGRKNGGHAYDTS